MQIIFSIAVENVKLIHECTPKHLRKRTARIKYGKQTEEEVKQKR